MPDGLLVDAVFVEFFTQFVDEKMEEELGLGLAFAVYYFLPFHIDV